jgi:hypothetical protein
MKRRASGDRAKQKQEMNTNQTTDKQKQREVNTATAVQVDYVHSVSTLRYVRPAPSKCFYTFIILFILTFLYNINTQDSDWGCRIEEEETRCA